VTKKIILLLVFATIVFANGKPTIVDKNIMNLSMNYEFESADQLFEKQYGKEESLKKHFLFLSIELMKILKAEDDVPFSERHATKEKMNNILIDYAENVVDKYEDENLALYDRFYFASIHGVLGRLYGVNRSWMSAFSSGKEGRNLMLDVIEEKPDFTDAYLLVGMMNYYADRMGGIIEFVAGILGLSGDRNLGLEYLNKVTKSGNLNNWQATMILVELYSRMEGNKFEALPLLEQLVDNFPKNSKFINWLGYEFLNTYQFDKLNKLINSDKGKHLNKFIEAQYLSNVGEYERANKLFDELLSKENTTWPRVFDNAKFVRIINHKFLLNDKKVKELSKELNEEYQNYFNIFSNNFTDLNKIEKFKIAVRNNDLSIAESLIENINDIKLSKFTKSQFYFYSGVYSFKLNNLNAAEEFFISAKELNPEDYNIKASQYLIHIYKKLNFPIEKVKKLLDDIDDYGNEGLEFFAQDLELKYGL
jgi:hypothetical protein